MSPETPQQIPVPVPDPEPEAPSWLRKFGAVLFCVFCLELGLFLLVYPWLGDLWDRNWLFSRRPELQRLFLSERFRGAVSGLGILNLIIGLLEVIRLRRFARH